MPQPDSAANEREWDDLDINEKVERLNYTLSTLASWLASAQTGFGQHDVQGIWNLLHHGSVKS